VYLLIVVNFQSWLDPFSILTALPAALAGLVLFLFVTHTTLSIPALMGASNDNGSRHREQYFAGVLCQGAARATTGMRWRLPSRRRFTRFRPVLMTGPGHDHRMVPWRWTRDGGEQNARSGAP